ncbi:MAG: antibiotic biosynthesis monooxygenase [Steroidobacteraceae bacterium]
MSRKIYSYAKFRIHEGKGEEFRRLARECSEIVNTREPGTLFYEWFFNRDGSECVALDCYVDVDALQEHVRNIGPLMRQLMAVADRYVEIYGDDPSPVWAKGATTSIRDFYGPRFLGKI